MVNAGRILIMPRGEWDALTSYNMLDLVTENGVAYLAKQANVGQDPALDTTMTYWQTFGSAVVPDGDTIIYDGNGDLAVNLDGTTLKYDAVNSYIKVAIDGVTLKYDSVNGYIYADVSTSLAGLDDVQLTSIQNGQIIAYNSTSQKFVNIDLPVGGGSKIKVTTAEATLYGQTVTLSDGVTTLSGTFSNSGEYTFEGVELTGNLTISSTDGNDRATRTLTVQYYSSYTVALAFFEATVTVTFPYTEGASCSISDGVTTIAATGSPMAFSIPNAGTWTATVTLDGATLPTQSAIITTDGQTEALTFSVGTINLTYDNDFRGTTITCAKGGTTMSKTAPGSGNTMVFYPTETGSWTITGTVSGTPYSTTANVTSLSTPVSVNLETIPDGSTTTPTDDIQKWLACAGIKDKAYTTLNEVLADSETYNALLGDSNACAYMKRSTTWSTDICASQYAMNLLGQYDTACDALLSDSTWASAIANSTYFESVLNVKVPVMTSNTTPEGQAFAGSRESAAYRSFDGANEGWYPSSDGNAYVGYKFTNPTIINKVWFKVWADTASRTFNVSFKGSNDGITWEEITTFSLTLPSSSDYQTGQIYHSFVNDQAYTYYRCDSYYYYSGSDGYELQFYGRASSSEKIHGGNPTYDSFYRIVDGNNVPVTDPSLLDAGTYTIYSNGLAKDPDNLSNDYGKTVRICPNTKEILVRPDNSLYWYGVMLNGCEEMSATNGWTGATFNSPTFNAQNVYAQAGGSGIGGGIGSKYPMTMTALHAIGLGTQVSGHGAYISYYSSKAPESATENTLSTTREHKVVTASGSYYVFGYSNSGSTVRSITLDALWTE